MKVLCIFVGLVVVINADYHEEVGIPLAAEIRAYEEELFSGGTPDMESRVAGGEIAPRGSHPYLVGFAIQLLDGRASMCSGALLTHDRVVTIAQCVMGAKYLEAIIGSRYLYYGDGTRMITEEFKPHPEFNISHSLDNDIANVKLPRPVVFTALIQPICLPCTSGEAEYQGEWTIVTGWGLTTDSDYLLSTNAEVHRANLRVMHEKRCKLTYHRSFKKKNNICTSGKGRVGTCRGDAGAPLVVQRNNVKLLVGLSSYGPRLCEQEKPSAFTRIRTFMKFIKHY